MLRRNASFALCTRIALLLLAAGSLGCFAVSRGQTDVDDHPVVNTGVGATIIYPGQSAPIYHPQLGSPPRGAAPQQPGQPPQPKPQAAPGTAPAPGAASPPPVPPSSYGSAPTTSVGPTGERTTGSPSPTGAPITMIGGAEQDIELHESWKQEPLWWKYLALPLAVVTAPFKYVAEALEPEPDSGPAVPVSRPEATAPGAQNAPPPQPAPVDYETAMLQNLERELENRQAQAAPSEASTPPSSSGAPTSIAEELAALQRTPSHGPSELPPQAAPRATTAPPLSPPSSVGRPESSAREVADGIVDRDGDGRVDQWIFRENGEIARVELDENRDGRPDRILHYDLGTHQIRRVEEDGNADGVSDSWTDYEDGRVSRRRGDGDYDGVADTWSFYRDGVITRHEQDTTGDGFRDRMGYYVDGKLVREEHDRDGDGRPDASIFYDASERVVRREEDQDGDGRTDVISYYEAGRLARRELLRNEPSADTARP